MRVATWNVNNVNKRLDLLLEWLARRRPDVVALQELKCTNADFPAEALRSAGYRSIAVGQRTWNGVALLARELEPLPVMKALPGDPLDKEARYVEAAIDGVLFGSLYLPNGNPQPGPKFDYKLRWFERLRARAADLSASGQPVVLMGDWNVVPTDEDIYKPDTWREDALMQPGPREAYAAVIAQGWADALKSVHPDGTPFTFWDYRRKRWERNAGLRIDHILTSAALQVRDAGVDAEERGKEGASDHAPVWAEVQLVSRSRSVEAGQPRVGGRGLRASGPSKKSVSGASGDRQSNRASPAAGHAATQAFDTASTSGPHAPLAAYNAKRNFGKTAEPAGLLPEDLPSPDSGRARLFVIQKHWASRLHYDFRLELDGVMVSWAVPKGPSFDPAAKQMAIRVEDHPVSYNDFEGTIPKGQYGAGKVIVWDRGTWEPVGTPQDGLAKGKLLFKLHGQKLAGLWELVRISKPGEKKQDQWILFKKRGDAWARALTEFDVISASPDSIIERPLGLVEHREPREAPGRLPRDVATAEDLRFARKAALPARLQPQLATLVAAVPEGDWIVETKFDGYRLMCRIDGSAVRLFTRNGHDWTDRLQPVAAAVAALGLERAWLDGEIVVLNDAGLPDFNQLQNAIDNARTKDIVLFVFDAPYFNGMDMREVPLVARRAVLQAFFDKHEGDTVRFSRSFEAQPSQMLSAACQMGLEGMMVKRSDAPYESGRTLSWMKLKCQHRQEFVIVGYVARAGTAGEIGSLLLGYHQGHTLRYAGAVGTGWGAATARELFLLLSKLHVDVPPIDRDEVKPGRWSRRAVGEERWVKPVKVVEIAFAEWTPDQHVRHAVFRGLREDKPAAQIVREEPARLGADSTRPASASVKARPALKVTNAERVIDPSTGLRKMDLVRYYESVADRILPHLKDRPVSLVRAPTGITGQLFFQKHPDSKMPGLRELDPTLWPGHGALLSVHTADALLAAAQMNVIEFHTWNSVTRRIDMPDRFILDLDPGEGVTWAMLQEAAVLTRTMLEALGLKSWLKTSGGKGLHVVVPIAPRLDYEAVKSFSQTVVRHMAKVIPSRFVAVMGGKNRIGKIFIDYLRNGHAQTTASAFSARSRPGLGVSMPVSWEQLPDLKGGAQWTIATAREYLSFQHADPWTDYWNAKQTLTKAIRTLKS